MNVVISSPFAAIFHLLRSRCPAAVLWLIVSVIVDAVNAQSQWSFSHVVKKVLESSPSPAYLDASTTVVFVIAVIWILTTLPHPNPHLVNWCAMIFRSAAVSVNSWRLSVLAYTARLRIACSQVIAWNGRLGAAVALAKPSNQFPFCSAHFFQHNEATESLSNQINFQHR